MAQNTPIVKLSDIQQAQAVFAALKQQVEEAERAYYAGCDKCEDGKLTQADVDTLYTALKQLEIKRNLQRRTVDTLKSIYLENMANSEEQGCHCNPRQHCPHCSTKDIEF